MIQALVSKLRSIGNRLSLSKSAITALLISLSVTLSLNAQSEQTTNWPQFRGSTGIGSTSAELPSTWTPENYKWKTAIPGRGWSSPVYVDGKAWMTSAIDQKATPEQVKKKLDGDRFARIKTAAASVEFFAVCVDLETGKILHNLALGKTNDPQPINPMNSYASPSAAIADGRVICHFGAYGTWCLDANTGEKIWDTKIVIKHSVGAGSSPIIADGKVILVCDGMEQQFVTALDLKNGKELWKTERPPIESTNGEFRKSYCTPIVRKLQGQQQVIVTGADWICSYNPANGDEIWRLNYGKGYSITGMPVLIDDLVVFVSGYDLNEMVAFIPNGSGPLEKSAIQWKAKGAPTMASIVFHEGAIYSANDRGVLSAIDPANGNTINRARTIGNLSASPLLANGKLYIANRDGQMAVISADEKLELLFQFDFGAPVYASPSPIGNDLLVRTAEGLIRISSE